jgi:hypothetical protein
MIQAVTLSTVQVIQRKTVSRGLLTIIMLVFPLISHGNYVKLKLGWWLSRLRFKLVPPAQGWEALPLKSTC